MSDEHSVVGSSRPIVTVTLMITTNSSRSLSRVRTVAFRAAAAFAIVASAGCSAGQNEGSSMSSSKTPAMRNVSDQDIARLSGAKIFFGHQSVGYNIVDGLKDAMAADPRLRFRILESRDVRDAEGGAFLHAAVGRNVFPNEKDSDFVSVLDAGFGRDGDIAVYKYCYVDVQPNTNAADLFANYVKTYEAAKAKYPALSIIHMTMPLMVSENSLTSRWRLWRMGFSQRALNVTRNEFNRLLLAKYGSSGMVFDLAALESTRPDGSREMYRNGADTVYSLVPSYTFDGGHLNEAARKQVAEQLVAMLARVNAARPARPTLVAMRSDTTSAASSRP